MMKTPYPSYDVLDKWDTPSFNAQTRAVLDQRLHAVPGRRFFSPEEWALLEAITARLIPQPDRVEPVPITPWIDERVADNKGEGFRHDGMPLPQDAWRKGLAGIDGEARRRHGVAFASLAADLQDGVLTAVQKGEVDEALWADLPAAGFFSNILLKTAVSVYYAHPAAWSEIGFGGPASPRGYVRLGTDRRDPWEAKETGRD